MNILAIDTAAAVFSIGLSVERSGGAVEHAADREGGSPPVRYVFEADAPSRHSELLTDMMDVLCSKAGIEREELGAVVCMKGPGSFTGLRIGWAAAKGLALALGIPMAAYPTLDCMAAPLAFWPGVVVPAIDAKRHSFYSALYRGGKPLTQAMDAEAAEIGRALVNASDHSAVPAPALITGPAAAMLCEALTPFAGGINLAVDNRGSSGYAGALLDIVLADIEKNSFLTDNVDILYSGPEYIRKSDAELNLTKGI